MQVALRTKMLWVAISTKSLWARFFKAKHLHNVHYSEAKFNLMVAADRMLWQRAANLITTNHRVLISQNDSPINFWMDVWASSTPLRDFLPPHIWANIAEKTCSV